MIIAAPIVILRNLPPVRNIYSHIFIEIHSFMFLSPTNSSSFRVTFITSCLYLSPSSITTTTTTTTTTTRLSYFHSQYLTNQYYFVTQNFQLLSTQQFLLNFLFLQSFSYHFHLVALILSLISLVLIIS